VLRRSWGGELGWAPTAGTQGSAPTLRRNCSLILDNPLLPVPQFPQKVSKTVGTLVTLQSPQESWLKRTRNGGLENTLAPTAS